MNAVDIYLACPFTDPDPVVQAARHNAANTAAARLIAAGFVVYSPLTHSVPLMEYGFGGDWATWERVDRAFLSVCRALIVMIIPGWNQSRGVQAEIAIAQEIGVPVIYWNPAAPQGLDAVETLRRLYDDVLGSRCR
jgi:nucleoside 2-deoxyribosyltransferase